MHLSVFTYDFVYLLKTSKNQIKIRNFKKTGPKLIFSFVSKRLTADKLKKLNYTINEFNI